MGIIGGTLGYKIMRRICADGQTGYLDGRAYQSRSKLEVLFGAGFWEKIAGRVVIDFGCGTGAEAVEMAQRGARKVIGVDLVEKHLKAAGDSAQRAGVADRCQFVRQTDEKADVIVTVDTFEHFSDPADILRIMRGLVRDDGRLLVSFGPTWYHPLGGHIFSVFPYAHLLFTEKALLRWFASITKSQHRSFLSMGLNKMTIGRFEKLVRSSDWRVEHFEAVPIRRLRPLANRWTREFTTAIVRCELSPR